MPHKLILGQGVGYTPPRGLIAPLGLYLVIAKLPERDGEFARRIGVGTAGGDVPGIGAEGGGQLPAGAADQYLVVLRAGLENSAVHAEAQRIALPDDQRVIERAGVVGEGVDVGGGAGALGIDAHHVRR